MSSHHNTTLNFSHSPYKNKSITNDINLEIKIGEFRLRYVQLMRDIHTTLNDDDAEVLINESLSIWEKISLKQ